MATTDTSEGSWSFLLNLQGDNTVPDAELLSTATESLKKIPGFLKVVENGDGVFQAEFSPSGEPREKIADAIQASGYGSRQASPDSTSHATGLPS